MLNNTNLSYDVLKELELVTSEYYLNESKKIIINPLSAQKISDQLNTPIVNIRTMKYDGNEVTGLEAIVKAFSKELIYHLNDNLELNDLSDVEIEDERNGDTLVLINGVWKNIHVYNNVEEIEDITTSATSATNIIPEHNHGTGITNYIVRFIDGITGKIGISKLIEENEYFRTDIGLRIGGSLRVKDIQHMNELSNRILVQADNGDILYKTIDEIITDVVIQEHNHDDRYYTKNQLQNSGQSLIHWNNLTNLPSTFNPLTHKASHSPNGSDSVYPSNGIGYLMNDGNGNLSWSVITIEGDYAPTVHQHSASDITSGLLPVSRGGTGIGNLNAGYVKSNGTNAFISIASIPWSDLSNIPSSFTPASHALVSSAHTVSGLTTGHFLKATGATSFGFAAHGLTYSDVGAASVEHVHDIEDVTSLQTTLDDKQPLNSKLTDISNLSVTDGLFLVGNGSSIVSRVLQNSDLPAIAITDTFVVSSQAAMLALSAAERGDVAVRTDLNKSFILKGDNPASLSDWQELLTPTDAVLSVDGRTGVVSLSDKYQPLDTDLTTIAGLIHANRHVLISDGSAWTRRALVEADLPNISAVKITSGILDNTRLSFDIADYVTIATSQTITGAKKFSEGITGITPADFNDIGTNNAARFTLFSASFQRPNGPSGASYWSGFEFRHNIGEDYRSQIAMGTTGITPQLAIRNKTNGVWGSWQRVLTTADNPSSIGAEPAITGTGNKVLSIQADGTGVKTGSIYDDGNVALIGKTTATPGGGYKLEVEGNTLVNGTLTVNVIPAKTTEVGVYLTHENNTIKTRTAAQVCADIGAASVSHGHAWSEITGKPSTFAPAAHGLVSSAHTVSGLTTGHVLKALSATTYGFAALTPSEIGAPAIGTERSLSITTAGWVTIATCATGRAYGEFHVYDSTSSRHNFTKIIASTSYGVNNVSVIGGNCFSTRSIAHVRVLYNTSDRIYGGAKLQVYCENPTFTLYVKQFLSQEFTNWKAWNNATPVAEGTPTGWAQDDSTYIPNITDVGLALGGDHISCRYVTPIDGTLSIKGDLFIWNKLQMVNRSGTAWDVIDRDTSGSGIGAMLKNIISLNSLTVHDSGFSKTGGTIGLTANIISLSGSVGINQSSPKNSLHIHGSSESFLQLTTNNTGSGDKYDGLTIGVDSTDSYVIRTNYGRKLKLQAESGTAPGSFLDFAVFESKYPYATPITTLNGNVTCTGDLICTGYNRSHKIVANGVMPSDSQRYWSIAASDMFTIMPWDTDNKETYLCHNMYYDGSVWRYRKDYGSSLLAFDQYGAIAFYSAPNGTAGAQLLYTEAFRANSELVKISKTLFLPNLKSGTTQANAGAAAGEVWRRTTDNVLCIGV